MKIQTRPEVHDHILDEFDNQYLTPYAIYEVIGINDEHYRVVDDNGEPILYPKYLFEVLDPSIPATWIRREYDIDEYHIDPPELCRPGFYEDYFDRQPEARAIFAQFLAAYTRGQQEEQ